MKNIVVFLYGDSSDPSTWSNVPYLLTTTLEKKGYNVIRVDISTKRNIFNLAFTLLIKILKPKSTYYFVRSNINRKIVNKKIKRAVEKYDSITDSYISISYDFSPSKYTNKKVLLFSDWPIEYDIEKRYNRKPDYLEQKDILRHKEIIESATYVISLFQDVTEYMNNRFKNKTLYLGNLINSFYPINGFEETSNRNKITFIGKKSYYDSAKKLLYAFNNLNNEKIELHIIGMTKNNFPSNLCSNKNVYFHGYLDKGNEAQKEEYYDVIKSSIVIVNTSDKWAGMSSIVESMYYYRPIITSRYDEFVKSFGNKINFGYYCDNTSKDIQNKLEKILSLNNKEYSNMAINSHNAVKKYTYDSYVDKILDLLKK